MLPVEPCNWQRQDAKGVWFPWYTWPFLHVLDSWDLRDCEVLELGGGWSTLWWASRAKKVLTIDNASNWVDGLRKVVPAHCRVELADTASAQLKLAQIQRWDVVIIDGFARSEALAEVMSLVKEGSVVIYDNSERMTQAQLEPLRYCERHSYPQPEHPDWRTDYWVVNTLKRWENRNFEEVHAYAKSFKWSDRQFQPGNPGATFGCPGRPPATAG